MVQWPRGSNVLRLAVAGAAIAAITLGFHFILRLHNPTIAALTYLLIVLVTATRARLSVAYELQCRCAPCPPHGSQDRRSPRREVVCRLRRNATRTAGKDSAERFTSPAREHPGGGEPRCNRRPRQGGSACSGAHRIRAEGRHHSRDFRAKRQVALGSAVAWIDDREVPGYDS